jgi:hypothetical protein
VGENVGEEGFDALAHRLPRRAPIRYDIVDGMNLRDGRVHNDPPRWNGAPSRDLLVIRRNHQTGEVSLALGSHSLLVGGPQGGRKPTNANASQ